MDTAFGMLLWSSARRRWSYSLDIVGSLTYIKRFRYLRMMLRVESFLVTWILQGLLGRDRAFQGVRPPPLYMLLDDVVTSYIRREFGDTADHKTQDDDAANFND